MNGSGWQQTLQWRQGSTRCSASCFLTTRWLLRPVLAVSAPLAYITDLQLFLSTAAQRIAGMQAVGGMPILQQLAVDVAAGRTQPLDLPGFHRHVMAAR